MVRIEKVFSEIQWVSILRKLAFRVQSCHMLQRPHIRSRLRAFIESKVIAPPVVWYTGLRFIASHDDAVGVTGAELIVEELLLVGWLLAEATRFANDAKAGLRLVLLFEQRLFLISAEEGVCSLG